MNRQVLVIPFDRALASDLRGRPLIIKISDFDLLTAIPSIVEQGQLKAVWIRTGRTLSSIPYAESWLGMPIALYASGAGNFLELVSALPLLRRLNIRFFLPASSRENITAVHILASLGIHAGLLFSPGPIEWEGVNDLMHYSVYSKVAHAPIEPFHFITSRYRPQEVISMAPVFFDDPLGYLHLNDQRQIALSDGDLNRGIFAAEGLAALNDIAENPSYQSAVNAAQKFFLTADGCAVCEAWRVCKGRFCDTFQDRPEDPECRRFSIDLLEAAESVFASSVAKGVSVWQS